VTGGWARRSLPGRRQALRRKPNQHAANLGSRRQEGRIGKDRYRADPGPPTSHRTQRDFRWDVSREVFFFIAWQQARLGRGSDNLKPGGSGQVYRSVPVPAPQYVHTEFGFVSPRRFRYRSLWIALAFLAVSGIGAAVMIPPGAHVSDAAAAPAGQIAAVETIPTASPTGFVAVNQQATANGTQAVADKPFCVGGRPSEGSCVSFQLPKVRMVRVPRVASGGQQSNSAKSSVAANSRAVRHRML
jgi:hypothetical protein